MRKTINISNYYHLPRIINGCWQISSGHNLHQQTKMDELFLQYVKSGLNTFDCADIYTGVEDLLGNFKADAVKKGFPVNIHTKFVPDLDALANLSDELIEKTIRRSCNRLRSSALDLVQFHWWRYEVGDYLRALDKLMALKQQNVIKHIGLTEF